MNLYLYICINRPPVYIHIFIYFRIYLYILYIFIYSTSQDLVDLFQLLICVKGIDNLDFPKGAK